MAAAKEAELQLARQQHEAERQKGQPVAQDIERYHKQIQEKARLPPPPSCTNIPRQTLLQKLFGAEEKVRRCCPYPRLQVNVTNGSVDEFDATALCPTSKRRPPGGVWACAGARVRGGTGVFKGSQGCVREVCR